MAQVRVGHPRFNSDEVGRRGEEIYQRLRPLVETEENIGKIISIDIETGDFEIGESGLETAGRLHEKHPGAAVYGARIGYDAVYGLGGAISRTTIP